MVVLYTPRKPSRLRLHKSIPRGQRLRLALPPQALGGIYATSLGYLNWRHLEAGRRFLTRQLRRARVKVRVRLTQPLTAKSRQARMGKGKGKFRGWVGFTRPGTLLYEVGSTNRQTWRSHPSAATRLSGTFPFERIHHKFGYGVKVLRQRPLRQRRSDSLGRGYGEGSALGERIDPDRRRLPELPFPPHQSLHRSRPTHPLLRRLGKADPLPPVGGGMLTRLGREGLPTAVHPSAAPASPPLQRRLGRLVGGLRLRSWQRRRRVFLELLRRLELRLPSTAAPEPSSVRLVRLYRSLRQLLRGLRLQRHRLREGEEAAEAYDWMTRYPEELRPLPGAEGRALVAQLRDEALEQPLGGHWYFLHQPQRTLLLHWRALLLKLRRRRVISSLEPGEEEVD